MTDFPVSHITANGITFFDRLDDEPPTTSEASNSGGVLSSFFGRLWKAEPSQSSQSNDSNGSGVDPVDMTIDTANTDSDVATSSSTEINRSSSQHAQARMSPSATSQNSVDSENSRKLSGKLTSLFKGGGKPGLQDYNRSNFKQYWMPDSTGRECYQCEERFTAFRRRHHCRLCGQIFCAKCCNIHVPGSALGYTGDLRLCHYCAKMMAQYLPPEADRRKNSDDSMPTGLAIALSSPSVDDPSNGSAMDSSDNHIGSSGISTVSAGSLLWSRQPERGQTPERKNSLSLPPPMYKPPSMLCVQELYNQHEQQLNPSQRQPSVSSALCEEDESGPDWFRNMDSRHNSIGNAMSKDESKVALCGPTSSIDDFEPLPIGELDALTIKDPGSISFEQTTAKNPLSQKSSINSPTNCPSGVDDDIDEAFERSIEKMLDYLFRRERIRDERWRPLVHALSKRIATTVKVDVEKRKDSMNILSYVHIKKLVVKESPPSTETIWGVVCNKTVLHSSMGRDLHNASVMIVAGSIEYERVQGKLSAIEPIICQEAEFLSKQVDRILSRRPSLLLVEGGVSRIAAQLLREAGVTVVTNCKASVLHRVARSTGADVLPSSDAQLIQQNIGFCPSFRQSVELLKGGQEKTMLILDECPPDRGCSVLIRGSCGRELRAIKRILQLMISLAYSAHLERAYLNLFNTRLAYQISNCEVCEIRRTNIDQSGERSPFEDALSESILGLSPLVDYEPPFLETPSGRSCTLLPYFKQPLYRFGTDEDFDTREAEELAEVARKESSENIVVTPSMPRHLYSTALDRAGGSSSGIASFRALGDKIFRKRVDQRTKKSGRMERSRSLDRVRRNDVLCPFVHQRVAVLFGSFSPKSPNAPYFCVRPWVLSMEFYADHDMTLGEFLTKYCFNKSYECPSTNCEIPMLDHSRKMVYGRVCVEVTTQAVVQSSGSDDQSSAYSNSNGQILTWHYCPTCKASSPIVPLNTQVWHLSFGKYLDYLANSAFAKGCITSPSSVQQECTHCFFHEQTQFYSQSNFVTTFKVTPIRPFDVQFSPVLCTIQPQQFTKKALLDGVTRMAALADDIVESAEDRLKVFTEHEHYTQYAGTFHTVLRQLVGNTATLVNEKRQYADVLNANDRAVISSNDILSIKANETMMFIREAIYQLITTWNDQSAVLGATIRAMRKGDDGVAADIPEIGIDRIDDPFPSYLHLGLKLQPRVGVVVRDIQDSRGNYKPDIGSIIAYALSSADYDDCRRRSRAAAGGEDVPLNLNSSSLPQDENILAAEHMEIEFQDQQASYYVKAYYAERFRLLRKLLFAEGEEAFIRSLSQSTFWTPQGGKSGSFFYRTQDDRFIVKQMSRFEIQSFVKFAPNYFEYVKTAVTEHKLTTLCKVYGVFRVGVKSKTTQLKVDILVMEYLFYKHNVKQVWDLKGSLRNRMASAGKTPNDVLLDENLMMDLWNKQLYVYPHSKAALNQAISNDSHFLSAQHVMDYSLLVGVDETNGELVLGIVDYMRTYTLDKKLESWVKIVAIPGAHLPTILSPEMYCTRFSEAIDTYFPVVPDQWTGLGSAVSY